MTNYAFTTDKSLPSAQNGQTFENCNFMQMAPNTTIFAGKTGLSFRKCNLVNCNVPADAQIDDCLHIHKSFCSHLHEKWIDKGLSECAENCSHVIDTDEIIIDGMKIDTIYHYADTGEV